MVIEKMRYIYNNYKIPTSVYERIDAALETVGCNNIDIDSFVLDDIATIIYILDRYAKDKTPVSTILKVVNLVNTVALIGMNR